MTYIPTETAKQATYLVFRLTRIGYKAWASGSEVATNAPANLALAYKLQVGRSAISN